MSLKVPATLTAATATNTMSPPTLIAYDGSGSTGGNAFYHRRTQEIVAQYPNTESQILYWDTSFKVITHQELSRINAAKQGGGGTESSTIANYIKATNFHGNLVIITDGQVGMGSVDCCTATLGTAWHFDSVTAHLIDTGGVVNMSVTCPFTRVSPHTVYCYYGRDDHGMTVATSVSAEDMAAVTELTTIATVADYEARADVIERLVMARTMGTMGDPSLRDAILAMKKRIIAAEAAALGDSDNVKALNAALRVGLTMDAVRAARSIHCEYYNGSERGWSARISRLISMCEGALRGAFDLSAVNSAIHSDRVRRGEVVATAPVPTEDAAGVSEAVTLGGSEPAFVCPVSLDATNDIILLVTEGEPIMAGLDKSIVNDVFDCPLNLFHYPEVVAALRNRLDHPLSLGAYREALEAGAPIRAGPLTRHPLIAGGICLGNTEEHCRATRWALAQIVTGGKLVGNEDLWFLCIWLLVARGEVPYLHDIAPALADHGRWRLQNHTTFIALTGLPEFPTTRVPLATAIWYVLASPLWTGSGADANPKRDLIRTHLPHLKELLKIHHELTDFALPEAERLGTHYKRIQVMLCMLGRVKRLGGERRLRELLLGLTQNSVFPATVLEGPIGAAVADKEHVPELIALDGLPTEAQLVAACHRLALPHALDDDTLVALGALVDPSKSAGDIALPFDWEPPAHAPLPGRVEWKYGTGPQPPKHVRICPLTCRPFYTTERGRTWAEEATELYGVAPSEMMSLNKKFGEFVCKYSAYPTPAEFLVFLYNRFVVHGHKRTLPHAVVEFINHVFDEFREVMETMPPAEFARRFEASAPLVVRQAQEVTAARAASRPAP